MMTRADLVGKLVAVRNQAPGVLFDPDRYYDFPGGTTIRVTEENRDFEDPCGGKHTGLVGFIGDDKKKGAIDISGVNLTLVAE